MKQAEATAAPGAADRYGAGGGGGVEIRLLVLGGTKFIGRRLVAECAAAGHEVIVVHRGVTEPDRDAATHLHIDRSDLPANRERLAALRPDAIVDTHALTKADAEAAVEAIPSDVPIVVLSSMDVYAAWEAVLAGEAGYAVPLTEESPLRQKRFPYRGRHPELEDYEKLDVEDVYRARSATICRLPAVFGPHDGQRREEFILRRVRAGRRRIPFGPGNWLWSRLHVADAAVAIRLMLETEKAHSETLHLAPRTCLTIRQYATRILRAAGHDAELVDVDEARLPEDLRITGATGQHLLADAAKARSLLGWDAAATTERIADSVTWHLAHPPDDSEPDFAADHAALAGTTVATD